MTERAYTVSELDALRRACENRYLYGSASPVFSENGTMSRSYMENEKSVAVEQMVRTHMVAGHTADDLIANDRQPARAEPVSQSGD